MTVKKEDKKYMGKLNLGDGFTGDGDKEIEGGNKSEEEKEKDQENKSGDEEKDNDSSADSSNSEDNKDDDEDDALDDDSKTDEDKQRELDGLKGAEDKIDTDVSELDLEITKAKDRVVNKRQDRRDKRDLVRNIDDKYPQDEEKDDLSDIDKETLEVLDRYTRSKGLVPKTELQKIKYEDSHKDAESVFFEKHPEYDSANDKDDFLYNALKEELSFFAQPKDPRLIVKLFEKAHKAVKEANPKFFKKSSNAEEIKAKEDRLDKARIDGGSSGGGTSSSDKTKGRKELNANQVAALRSGGWSEDEIKNF